MAARSTEKERIIKAAREGKSEEEIAEAAIGRDENGKPHKRRTEQNAETKPGDNRRYIQHAMRLAALEPVDMSNAGQVSERCNLYFQWAAEDDMKPSMAALALALGTSRPTLMRCINGYEGKREDVRNVLKRATSVLDSLMNDYMANGKINPVSGIFLMTNTLNYQQRAEVTVAPAQPLGEGRDPDELRRRYLESVVPSSLPDAESPFDVIEVEYADVPEESAEN